MKTWNKKTKRLTSILSYMTDGVLATNRRGQIIMVNEMAAKQLNVNPDEVLNTSILDLLSLGDDYDLRSLITEVPELTIDSQDENGEYLSLRVRFALIRRESGFISGLVAVLSRYDRAGQGRTGTSPLCLQCES